MTLPRTVADVLADHVVFEVECIDRMYCNVYVLHLQHAGGLLGYIQRQLGLPIASTAPLGKITDAFSAAMRRFAREQRGAWVDFAKGQRKDDVMHEHLARFTGEEGVLFIGRAQEKTSLFRTERRRDAHGDSYPWIVKTTGVVNQFYVYAVDEDFGPFFLKFGSYFPYNAKLCLNGHEWGAPCGASSYPRCSWEEFGGTFLGSMTYLDLKSEGNSSMSGKQRSSEGVEDEVLRNPRDTVKAGLPEP